MPNPSFQFKKFTIHHDKCAMKVGTDGVLLGAWANIDGSANILDVGCGSGLISLMIAQRNINAFIHAIDIDKDAIIQTKENIICSPFSDRVTCQEISLQDFVESEVKLYDSIISNPPFFNRSLKSPDNQRTLARHTDSLYIDDLIHISANLLASEGLLSVIFPYAEKDNLIKIALSENLFVSRITNIYPTPTSEPKRVLLEFSKSEKRITEMDLIIEESRHVYTQQFTQLLRDFYLKM